MIKQLNFFNWLSNVKNVVLSNGSEPCELWFNGIKIAFFSKKSPNGWGLRLQTLVCDMFELGYTKFLNTSPELDICIFQLLV